VRGQCAIVGHSLFPRVELVEIQHQEAYRLLGRSSIHTSIHTLIPFPSSCVGQKQAKPDMVAYKNQKPATRPDTYGHIKGVKMCGDALDVGVGYGWCDPVGNNSALILPPSFKSPPPF
jgi:hypothetical protein